MHIPFITPVIGEEETEAVTRVLRSKWLSQGEEVAEFEREFAEYVGAREAIAVSNGTVALHLTMIVAGMHPGDEVIVPSFTFVSTANAAVFQGATPVFAEIDSRTFNILPEDISRKITNRTRAIIPVHYGGQVADMDPITRIAKEHGLVVIEDAAEAHGARYKDKYAGVIGDMAIFSFTPTKNITTGEGGMITTDNQGYAEKLRMLRNHGMDAPYHHVMLGYNYRMTEMQAAIGLVQLGRLEEIVARKNRMADYYDSRLGEYGIITPHVAPFTTQHPYMLYTIKISPDRRDDLVRGLNDRGIEARSTYFPPVHLQPFYRDRFGLQEGMLQITEEVARQVVSLPISPTLSNVEVEYIMATLHDIAIEVGI